MNLSELIGPMLGVDWNFVYATGSGTVGTETRSETYAEWNRLRVLQRSDGIIHTSSTTESTTRNCKDVLDTGPALSRTRWLGVTDRLLRPSLLNVWGRPGEGWRLTEEVAEAPHWAAYIITLVTANDARRGSLEVDAIHGHARAIDLPGVLSWRLDEIVDDPDALPQEDADYESDSPLTPDHVLALARRG